MTDTPAGRRWFACEPQAPEGGIRRRVWPALAGVLVACSPSPASFTAAHRAAIVDSVHAMLAQWRDALNAMDFERVAGFYATDSAFRWYEDGRLTFVSAAAVRDSMLAMKPALRGFEATFTDTRVTPLAPGMAAVTAGFTEKLTDTTGAMIGYSGAISVVVTHTGAGWQMLIGHNSSLPPPAGTGANARRH